MIRLIASDIDGTLLPHGQKAVSPDLFPLIRRLQRAGVVFCPASGRQYHAMRELFAPMADELHFLCENGAVVFGPGSEERSPVLSRTAMDRSDALALANDILAGPDCELLVSCQRKSYFCSRSDTLYRQLVDGFGYILEYVERPEDVPGDILKVSAFCPNGPRPTIERLGERWSSRFRMCIGGPVWLDFGIGEKGTGLLELCRKLEIDPSEVMAFGDSENDVSMLQAVGVPYLMDIAAPHLKARFPRRCSDVLAVLEELARELGV